jgi:hypothetical protein
MMKTLLTVLSAGRLTFRRAALFCPRLKDSGQTSGAIDAMAYRNCELRRGARKRLQPVQRLHFRQLVQNQTAGDPQPRQAAQAQQFGAVLGQREHA